MKNLIRIFFLLLVIGGVISLENSCSEEDICGSSYGRYMMYCTLRTINPDEPDVVLNDTLDSLTVTAIGTDSIIINRERNVHTLALPLRYSTDTTIFIFRYAPNSNPRYVDTVCIIHENTPFFESMDCGYTVEQNIVSATFKAGSSRQPDRIDSIYIQNRAANNIETQNLQIFYNYREDRGSEETTD